MTRRDKEKRERNEIGLFSGTGPPITLMIHYLALSYPNSNTDKPAIVQMHPGDAVLIFTPDDTHYTIARHAIEVSTRTAMWLGRGLGEKEYFRMGYTNTEMSFLVGFVLFGTFLLSNT